MNILYQTIKMCILLLTEIFKSIKKAGTVFLAKVRP
jgi:hypothetical protein